MATSCGLTKSKEQNGSQGSVFEASLTDLQNDDIAFRKFRLLTEDVQDKNCLTNFLGMDLISDKMCSQVKKWQILFEGIKFYFENVMNVKIYFICSAALLYRRSTRDFKVTQNKFRILKVSLEVIKVTFFTLHVITLW